MSSRGNQSYVPQSPTLGRSLSGSQHDPNNQHILNSIPMKPHNNGPNIGSHTPQPLLSTSSRAQSYLPSVQLPPQQNRANSTQNQNQAYSYSQHSGHPSIIPLSSVPFPFPSQNFTHSNSNSIPHNQNPSNTVNTVNINTNAGQHSFSNQYGNHSPHLQPMEGRLSYHNGPPGLPLSLTPGMHMPYQSSNGYTSSHGVHGDGSNQNTPQFSSRNSTTGSIRGLNLLTSGNNTPPLSTINSPLSSQLQNNLFSHNGMNNSQYNMLQSSPSQQTQPPQSQSQPLAIVPIQQSLVFEDPLLKSTEAQAAAHRSRTLMRSHYKGTGFCILFICIMFLISCPVTYFIARSKYKNELQNYTKEHCTVDKIESTSFQVNTTCGTAIGFRHNIIVSFDGKPQSICSVAPYHCYRASSQLEPDNEDSLDGNSTPSLSFSSNIQISTDLFINVLSPQKTASTLFSMSNQPNSKMFLSNAFPTSILPPHAIVLDSLQDTSFFYAPSNQTSTRASLNTSFLALTTPVSLSADHSLFTLNAEPTHIESPHTHFDCTLCLRNNVEQCFSPISDRPDTYQNLIPGTILENCWEYTTSTDGNLSYRYFFGDPEELLGYPYIHSWYFFFWIGAGVFFLISVYYIVKGVGICDCIDPDFWKKRRAKKSKKNQHGSDSTDATANKDEKSSHNVKTDYLADDLFDLNADSTGYVAIQ